MSTRFKPMLAAAFAAGLIPAFSGEKAEAGTITAAAFGFEKLAGSSAGLSSLSLMADSFSPGYGGTMVALKSAPDGYFSSTSGNASSTALKALDSAGMSYTFSFSIDNLSNLQFAFDMTVGTNSPRDFVLEYSLDGTHFTAVSSLTLNNWGWNGFYNITGASYAINLPSDFSDAKPGVSGDTGYLLITQIGTDISAGPPVTVSTGSVASIDNVFITGSAVPEPATVGIVGLAGIGLLGRRRR